MQNNQKYLVEIKYKKKSSEQQQNIYNFQWYQTNKLHIKIFIQIMNEYFITFQICQTNWILLQVSIIIQIYHIFIVIMTQSPRSPMTSEMLEVMIKKLLEQQLNHQKNGNYVDAEKCKLDYENSKKNLQKRRQFQMQQRHKKQVHDIEKAHNDELSSFNKFWDQKLEQFKNQGDHLVKELTQKHNKQYHNTREQLDKTLPIKLKQSSQLLNLRKMQEHMAKQKNYVQAHKVQTKGQKLQKQQTEAWIQARNNKINTALSTLKNRQNAQMTTLKKRISAGTDQQNRDRQIQQNRLKQKYDNVCKQLKSQHEKEILFFKGQFRSKVNSSGSPTKSK